MADPRRSPQEEADDMWATLGVQPAKPVAPVEEEPEDEERERAVSNMWRSLETDADRRARMFRDAEALNHAPQIGTVAEDRLRKAAEAKAARERVEASPGLARWFARDGRNAQIAHDDTEALSQVEGLVRRIDPWRAAEEVRRGVEGAGREVVRDPLLLLGLGRRQRGVWRQGLDQGRRVGHSWQAAGLSEQRMRLYAKQARSVLGADQWTPDDDRKLADLARQEADERNRGLSSRVGADVVGGFRSAVSGVAAGLGGAARGPFDALRDDEFAVVAPISGYLEASADFTAEMEAGSAFEQYTRVRTTDGRPLDRKLAAEAAGMVGAINAGIEFVGGAAFGFASLGVKELRKKLVAEGGQAAIRSYALRSVLTRYGVQVASSAVGEGGEEIAQGLVREAGRIEAQRSDGGEFPATDWNEVWNQLAYEGAIGATVGAVFGGVGAAPSLGADLAARERALDTSATITKLAEATRASKLAKRDPEAYADAVDAMAPEAQVYIDADAFVTLAQEMRSDPAQVAESLGIPRETLTNAQQSDGWISVSPGAYASKIALTQIGSRLAEHVSFERGGVTAAQAAKDEATAERFAEETKQLLTERTAQATAVREVYEDILANWNQISDRTGYTRKANEQYAILHLSFLRAQAERDGTDIKTLYERIKPRLVSQMTPDSAVLNDDLEAVIERLPEGIEVPVESIRVARAKRADPRRAGETAPVREAVGYWMAGEGQTLETAGGPATTKKGDVVVSRADGSLAVMPAQEFFSTHDADIGAADMVGAFGGVEALAQEAPSAATPLEQRDGDRPVASAEAKRIADAIREAGACAAATAGAGAATVPAGAVELMAGNAIGATAGLVVSVPMASAIGADNRKRVAEAYARHLRATAPTALAEPTPYLPPTGPAVSPGAGPTSAAAAPLPDEDEGFDRAERFGRYVEPADREEPE